jgi:hypothetical protein
MSVTIAECAENARLCRWYASKTNNADERRFLLRMAKRWTALAVEKEREMRNAVGRLTNGEKAIAFRQPPALPDQSKSDHPRRPSRY